MIQAPDYTWQAEPAPSDGDIIVLSEAVRWVEQNYRMEDLWLVDALRKRAEIGREEYGDYLRTYNGRRPLVDYLQEQLDAVMYAVQAYLETEDEEVIELIEVSSSSAIHALCLLEKYGYIDRKIGPVYLDLETDVKQKTR